MDPPGTEVYAPKLTAIKSRLCDRPGLNVALFVLPLLLPNLCIFGIVPTLYSALPLLVGSVYVLPVAVAVVRGCRHSGSIALLNVFSGWTILGWVLALIWSSKSPVVDDNGKSSLNAGALISLVSVAMALAGFVSSSLANLGLISFLLQTIVLPAHWGLTNYRIHLVLGKTSGVHQITGWTAYMASTLSSSVAFAEGAALAITARVLDELFQIVNRAAGSGPSLVLYQMVSVIVLFGSVMLVALGTARITFLLSNAICQGRSRSLIYKLLPSAGFFAVSVYAPFALDADMLFPSIRCISIWLGVAFYCAYFFTRSLLESSAEDKVRL
ncbi:MAG: superinfection immunity protein [Candidatus Obscuribacterales bacterium]|nr:superinfection immunity protein [Candidatus Obscuribacterales bacterium]